MKTKSVQKISFRQLPKDYGELCRFLLPRPIRDDTDYQDVASMADSMALWQDEFTPDQADYFELLCSLIEDYDSEHVKPTKLKAVDLLKHLLAEHEMSGADLSRLLGGSRNLGAMILRGERNLTVDHIRKLSGHFKLSPELFL